MVQKHKFVEKNFELFRTLTRNGYVSPKLLEYYYIYLTYINIKEKSRLDRYKVVAEIKKISPHTVRRAVCDMKKYIRD